LYRTGGFAGPNASDATSAVIRYDDATNAWEYRPNGTIRAHSANFSINGFGYRCAGQNATAALSSSEQFNPALDNWGVRASIPVALNLCLTGLLNLNGYGYSCGGMAYNDQGENVGPVSSLYQYRDHAPYMFPLVFKKSDKPPKRIQVGTSVNGRAVSLPVMMISGTGFVGSNPGIWYYLMSNVDSDDRMNKRLAGNFPTVPGSEFWVARNPLPAARVAHVGFTLDSGYV